MGLFNAPKKQPLWYETPKVERDDTDIFGLTNRGIYETSNINSYDVLSSLIDKAIEIYASYQDDGNRANQAVQQLRNMVNGGDKDPNKMLNVLSTIFGVLGGTVVVELFNDIDKKSVNNLIEKLLNNFAEVEIAEDSKYVDFGDWGVKTNFSENRTTGAEAKIAADFKIWLANNDANAITTIGKFKKMWDSFKTKDQSYMTANIDKVWSEYERIR